MAAGTPPEGGPGGGGMGGGGEQVGDYSLTITGGTLVVDAEGDGLDSNGTVAMTGGTVVVDGPANSGNGALDVNGDFTVDGGTLVAAGSAGMVVSPSADSKQGWVSATLDNAVEAGTVIQIVNADNEVIATYTTSKRVQNVLLSTADISSGEEYSIYTGGTASGHAGGLLHPARSARPRRSPRSRPAKHRPAGWVAVVVPADPISSCFLPGVPPRCALARPSFLDGNSSTPPDVPDPEPTNRRQRRGPTAAPAAPARSTTRPPRSPLGSTSGVPAG